MPSILPGFNYDIFVSYRHKDNKYDGWVTEFVQNLKRELDATFKEDISIYFDFNPDDGLLESNDVNKSLEGKLNCLIFIPVLSQTYCDPKSFSWQHEFQAFNAGSKKDMFGRDIKLRNGNVSSRILPIRVRDLDAEDQKLLEDEMGSVLRPIDFIYKEQGVNRPLKPEDPEERNLNHTKYRNQINKTANAIKELMTALKLKASGAPEPVAVPQPVAEPVESPRTPEPVETGRRGKRKRTPLEWGLRTIAVVGIVFYFVFFNDKKKHRDKDNDGDDESAEVIDKSIAVLPFEDLSAGHDQEYFSDGIAEEILNSLAHINGLKVAGRTSSFQFKGQKTDLKEVGKKLNVATVLEGSVRKAGNRLRITAQLIGVKDGYHIWSETYDREMTDIFAIQDEVANKIASVLLKEMAVKTTHKQEGTENIKAYEYYLEGKYINLHQFITSGKVEDFLRSEELFKNALKLDSNYALAHAGLADLYNSYINRVKRDPKYLKLQNVESEKAYRLNPNLDYVNNARAQVQGSMLHYDSAFQSFTRAIEINPKEGNNLVGMASIFFQFGLLDESIKLCDRAIAIEPLEATNYFTRGSAYFQINKIEPAIVDLKEAARLEPENYGAVVQLCFIYIIKNQMDVAKEYLDKAKILKPTVMGKAIAESVYEARLGHKEQALALCRDWRTYLVLGMKKEAVDEIMKTFSTLVPPQNVYLALETSALAKRVEDDPRIKAFMAKQKEGYLANKAKYKVPELD